MTLRTKAGSLLAVLVLAILASGAAAWAQAQSGLWADIKKRGKVVVATEAQYYPFEFLENGEDRRLSQGRARPDHQGLGRPDGAARPPVHWNTPRTLAEEV